MNRTNFEHAFFALLMQVVVVLLTGNWWVGAAIGAGFFLGREHAQAEYRWIKAYGGSQRINVPWWGGFDPRVWTHADSWLDWIVPTFSVSIAAIVAGLVF